MSTEAPAAATFSESINNAYIYVVNNLPNVPNAIGRTVSDAAGSVFNFFSESTPVIYAKSLGEHQYVQVVISHLPHALGAASGCIAAQAAVDLVNDYKKDNVEGESNKLNARSLIKFGSASIVSALAYTQTEQKADVLSTILAGIAVGSFIKAVKKENVDDSRFTLETKTEKA